MKEKTIPKTTSGKIQRRKTRILLHNRGLDVLYELSDALGDTTTAAITQHAPGTTELGVPSIAAFEKPVTSPCPETSSNTSTNDSSGNMDNNKVRSCKVGHYCRAR